MAENKIIIEIKDDSLPPEKPQRGSGGGQGSGGGGPDSPGSRKSGSRSKSKRRGSSFGSQQIWGRGGRKRYFSSKDFDPEFVQRFGYGPGMIPPVGSMDDIGASLKGSGAGKPVPGTPAYDRRRKYLLNKRRKATTRREARWERDGRRSVDAAERDENRQRAADIRSENKQRKLRDKFNKEQQRKADKAKKDQEKEASKQQRARIVRGTKMQNIASGGLRQSAVIAGGGRVGAVAGAAQTFAKFLGPLAGPVAVLAGGAVAAAASMYLLQKAVMSADAAFTAYAKRVADYSAPVSQAMAISDLRRQQMTIRQANVLGSDLAEYTNQRSIIESQIDDIKLAIVERFLPIFLDVMPVLSEMIERAGPLIDALLEMPWDVLGELIKLFMDTQGEVWKKQAEAVDFVQQIMTILWGLLDLEKQKQEEDELKKISEITQAKLVKFLNLNIPPDIEAKLNGNAGGGAPGARANVPMPGLANPLGGP